MRSITYLASSLRLGRTNVLSQVRVKWEYYSMKSISGGVFSRGHYCSFSFSFTQTRIIQRSEQRLPRPIPRYLQLESLTSENSKCKRENLGQVLCRARWFAASPLGLVGSMPLPRGRMLCAGEMSRRWG